MRSPDRPLLFVMVTAGCGFAFIALIACLPHVEAQVASGDKAATVTFSHDIAPIVFANCSYCHRPGEAAPFSLLTYDDVRRRAVQIAEVTQRRFMPPWQPKQGYGDFAGARRLSDQQIETLAAWAKAGAPLGDEAEMPPAPRFTEGWQLGPPDLVLETPPYALIADGSDQFRNFVIPIDLESPRWVEAIELRPENPRVTHHARLGVDSSHESARRDAADPEPGYEGMAWGQDPSGQLVTWAPGMIARPGTPGTAWRLHPKTALVLHTHMQPSGKPETVRFRVGFHFTNEAPVKRPLILRIGTRNIDIPAGAANHVVTDEFVVPADMDVHYVFPHAHSLCREMSVNARLPDGSERPLIWIEHFDENWHDRYRYVKPVRIPRGAVLVTRYAYDNTDANLRNRHRPPRRVVYGPNVDDEMSDVYLQVTAARADQRAMLLEEYEAWEHQSEVVGFRKTLEGYPTDAWSREGMAASYLAMGQPAQALQAMEERLNTGSPEVHAVAILGMACFAAGDPARAEKSLRQALDMDAAYPLAWLGLGKVLAARNKADDAEKAYRRALELAPSLSEAHLGLADILLRRGRVEEAGAACEAALETSPEMPHILMKLAEIRVHEGRYDESLQLLTAAHENAPYIHPPKVLLAAYCSKRDEGERAKELLGEARAEMPSHPVPALFLAQIARVEKRTEDAKRQLAAATAAALPDNWPASHRKRFLILLQSERFQLAQEIGDKPMARDALEQWLEHEPENARLRQLYDEYKSGK